MRSEALRTLTFCLCAMAACNGGDLVNDAGNDARVGNDASARDAALDANRLDAFRFDAGPSPACTVVPFARRVATRPGGDSVQAPQFLAAVDGGFLLGAHRVDRDPDAGAGAGATRDTVDLIPVGDDGMPRGTVVTVHDALAANDAASKPVIVSTPSGAYVFFTLGNGLPLSDASSTLALFGTPVDALGAGAAPMQLRDRYTLPSAVPLGGDHILAVSVQVDLPTDSGIVVAEPTALYLDATGTSVRPTDQDLGALVAFDASNFALGTTDSGGAVYGYVSEGQPAFVTFDAQGVTDPHGAHVVRGSSPVTGAASFAGAGDAVVAAWSTSNGNASEVHAVIAGPLGEFRVERVLEQFAGEGPTVATAVPAYGGVAVLWRRGVDANARVRVAVIAPDGTVVIPAQDLLATPGLEGPIVAVTRGREVALAAQHGLAPDWGYLLARACIPAP